jgi:hypothetical protein
MGLRLTPLLERVSKRLPSLETFRKSASAKPLDQGYVIHFIWGPDETSESKGPRERFGASKPVTDNYQHYSR